MAKTSFPKKITTATIGLTPQKVTEVALTAKEEPVTVARVYGRIMKTEDGMSQFGPYTKFHGEHEGINCLDESIARSRVLILPEVGATMLNAVVGNAKQESPDAVVQYGVDITVKYYDNPSKDGAKYEWGCVPLMDIAQDDMISKLGQSFGAIPKLSLPKPNGKKK